MHAEELMKAADANPIAIRLDFDKITHVTKSN